MTDIRRQLGDHIIGVAHVGFVVADLELALDDFRRLYGLDESAIRREPAADVETLTRFAFFEIGGQEFELIEPCSEEFKQQLLGMPSGGGGINHVAWLVTDIEGALECLAQVAIYPGHVTPDGVVNIGAKKMVYLDPDTTGGLVVELIEHVGDIAAHAK
jgi:methylmalonyl-CoA/ethylmalonyl-CoA epimerase